MDIYINNVFKSLFNELRKEKFPLKIKKHFFKNKYLIIDANYMYIDANLILKKYHDRIDISKYKVSVDGSFSSLIEAEKFIKDMNVFALLNKM